MQVFGNGTSTHQTRSMSQKKLLEPISHDNYSRFEIVKPKYNEHSLGSFILLEKVPCFRKKHGIHIQFPLSDVLVDPTPVGLTFPYKLKLAANNAVAAK